MKASKMLTIFEKDPKTVFHGFLSFKKDPIFKMDDTGLYRLEKTEDKNSPFKSIKSDKYLNQLPHIKWREKTPKILSCPGCGYKPRIHHYPGKRKACIVKCTKWIKGCKISQIFYGHSKREVTIQWNQFVKSEYSEQQK